MTKKTTKNKTTTSTSYVIKHPRNFETEWDQLKHEPEYKHLMRISKELNLKI